MLESQDNEVAHRLLGPRSTFLVGTVGADLTPHLCAASNVTSVGTNPQMVVLALTPESQTAGNVLRTSEFTLNLLAADYLDAIWIAGRRYSGVDVRGRDDSFVLSGLTPGTSHLLAAPGIEEAMASIECRVVEAMKDRGDHTIFLAEIVGASCDPTIFDNRGILRLEGAAPAMQLSGDRFATAVPHPSPDTARCNALIAERLSADP
jgi:flavin reductase (DIM6/NTAB) family NADH-FMN oxidoreductase RutF